MDLEQMDTRAGAEQGFDLDILNADGARTDIVITVLGADSNAYRDAIGELVRRRQQQRIRNKRFTPAPEEVRSEERRVGKECRL